MAAIPDEAKHLFENKDFAHVATVNKDGSPQVSPVWIGIDRGLGAIEAESNARHRRLTFTAACRRIAPGFPPAPRWR